MGLEYFLTNYFFFNNWIHYVNYINTIFSLYPYILPSNGTTFYSIKLVLLLGFLLLMRGGTPRYRYDYLTKLGWLKFLSFAFSIILIVFLGYIVL